MHIETGLRVFSRTLLLPAYGDVRMRRWWAANVSRGPMTSQQLAPEHLGQVQSLLRESGLLAQDLNETHMSGFRGFFSSGELLAVGGVELLQPYALLRSLAVRDSSRSQGLAATLLRELEAQARGAAITHIYLLTEDAADYFLRFEYEVAERSQAPAAIAGTGQFSALCPADAVFMKKRLQ